METLSQLTNLTNHYESPLRSSESIIFLMTYFKAIDLFGFGNASFLFGSENFKIPSM